MGVRMNSPDHPELAYVEARQSDGSPMYTRGRPDGPPLWIVVHDMEAHELPTTAENTANYFATGAGGRQVSSHYTGDSNSVVQCVRLDDVAWTVGNRAGNYRGINWELAGFASQSREEWLDDFGRAMFATMAPIVRSDAARYNIPLERRTVAELRLWMPGVTSHNDLRLAFDVTDHTDPGPNFPWPEFLAIMNGDDVTAADNWEYEFQNPGKPPGTLEQAQTYLAYANKYAFDAMNAANAAVAKLDEVLTLLKQGGGSTDAAAIIAAVRGEAEAVKAEVRDAVADLGEGGAVQVRNDPDA